MRDKSSADSQNQIIAVAATHDVIYDLFMLAITIYSLAVIVSLLVLPLTLATRTLLIRVDVAICFVLLIDFFLSLFLSSSRTHYFFRQGGWLDLLGSVPILFGHPWTAILRLARLPRLAGIVRRVRGKTGAEIRRELHSDRPKGALLLTVLVALVMIAVAGAVVLQVEARAADPNIVTGGDAFWWAYVTITTVGYGDHYPTTGMGRVMAVILMAIGVGIFAVLTSFLASILLGSDDDNSELVAVREELVQQRNEIAAMRGQLDDLRQMLVEGRPSDSEH